MNINIRADGILVEFAFCRFGADNRPTEVQQLFQLSWQEADELYLGMKLGVDKVNFPRRNCKVLRHLTRWDFLVGGKLVLALPIPIEAAFRKQLFHAARGAEEVAKANEQIAQDALLTRSGAPFSMIRNPKAREEAIKEAQWDSKARKKMPMNDIRLAAAQSCREVGAPSVQGGKNVRNLH